MNGASPLFLDTSGLIAVLVADDSLHEEAAKHFETIGRSGQPMVTTDWVLAELGNGLARTPARVLAAELVERITTSSQIRLLYVNDALLSRGLARYRQYTDKTWGLVDCVSFEVMNDTNCSTALTSDRHFEQAGFVRILGAD